MKRDDDDDPARAAIRAMGNGIAWGMPVAVLVVLGDAMDWPFWVYLVLSVSIGVIVGLVGRIARRRHDAQP